MHGRYKNSKMGKLNNKNCTRKSVKVCRMHFNAKQKPHTSITLGHTTMTVTKLDGESLEQLDIKIKISVRYHLGKP